MPVLSKLIKIWAMGKAMSLNIPPLQNLLSGLATIAILIIISAVLTGAFIMGGLYFTYYELLLHGISPENAMQIMGAIIVLLIVLLLGWAWSCWKKLTQIQRNFMRPGRRSLSDRVTRVTNSFLDGLFGDAHEEDY